MVEPRINLISMNPSKSWCVLLCFNRAGKPFLHGVTGLAIVNTGSSFGCGCPLESFLVSIPWTEMATTGIPSIMNAGLSILGFFDCSSHESELDSVGCNCATLNCSMVEHHLKRWKSAYTPPRPTSLMKHQMSNGFLIGKRPGNNLTGVSYPAHYTAWMGV